MDVFREKIQTIQIADHFSKFNGNLGISGCVKPFFQKIGVINYNKEIVGSYEDFFEFCDQDETCLENI